MKCKYVSVDNQKQVWTLHLNPDEQKRVPLVLVHGFGAGAGLWALNLDELAKRQSVFAIDVLGFGRSSRPDFSGDAAEAEQQFVESIEQWRKEVGISKFILLGHSLGGFIACSYALRYPEHVRHLILADPWGMNEKPPPGEEPIRIPRWARIVAAMLSPFNPLSAVRAAGPYGMLISCSPQISFWLSMLWLCLFVDKIEYNLHRSIIMNWVKC